MSGGRRLPDELVLATHNAGKVREIAALLAPRGVRVRAAGALGLPEPDETGITYVENAHLKAAAAAAATGRAALADDSGVAVTALGGEPGIHTARLAGPARDWAGAMRAVEARLRALGPGASREAYFVCALCVAFPDGEWEAFEGRVRGLLVWPPRGHEGSGFEPMFMPDDEHRTYGEMTPEERQVKNHRARAFAAFTARFFGA